jgi:hypothetical protein
MYAAMKSSPKSARNGAHDSSSPSASRRSAEGVIVGSSPQAAWPAAELEPSSIPESGAEHGGGGNKVRRRARSRC